ncbi:GtrA family protein [Vibrio makurazakiensis]|uniref:GtrA family protein n=1 Tax=Vibrio makurazakiensis TaxID=2910250 RepID=UPI003D0D40B0
MLSRVSITPMLVKHSQLIKFGCVGAAGFVIDYAVFSLAYYVFGLPILNARIAAFLVAATSTWYGNRKLTFLQVRYKGNTALAFKQWQKFMCSALISAIPNLLVFKLLVDVLPEQGVTTFIAMVVGVLVGMVSNFLFSRYWVFTS